MRRALLATLALVVPLASCRRETDVDRAFRERTLLVGNSAEPKALDPQLVTGVIEGKVISALFEGLAADDPASDEALPPGAALSWQPNATRDRWVFHLRRNARWSDGAPVTAHDFVFSYHRMLHPLLAAHYAGMLYPLANAEAYNRDRRGFILFGISPDPALPWDQLRDVNFEGRPDAGPNPPAPNPRFDALDPPARVRWLRHRGLDRLTRPQLEWIAADPASRFEWPATLPPPLRDAVLRRLLAHHGRDLWDLARVGVRALDDFTLELALHQPLPFLPALTRHHSWFPVPRHVVLQHGTIHARFTPWSEPPHHVGNGPFRLARWRIHEFIETERNPHYWQAGQVWLNAIRFIPIENPYTETRAFLAGQLHTTYVLPPDLVPAIRRSHPAALRQEPYVGTTFIRLNTTRPALDNPLVRSALSLAIDRRQLCRHILEGFSPATGLTPPMGSYQPEPTLRFDPPEARRRLAAAGFPDGRGFPRYTILISRPSGRAPAETIQAMWKQHLGIFADIANKDWGSYVSAQQALDYDMASANWIGDFLDPTTFLELWTRGGGNNNTGWHDPAYQDLLGQAARLPDPAARLATLRRAERLLLDAQPIIPLAWYARNYLHHPSVAGWHPLLLDNHPWKTIRFRANHE